MANTIKINWQDRLPIESGKWTQNELLSRYTWFDVGGKADYFYQSSSVNELQQMLQAIPLEIPRTIIGSASNLIIRDGGVRGVVVKLSSGFKSSEWLADGVSLRVGAAALDMKIASLALEKRVTGFEFLSGIPGTIGGAIAMNAGAYGGQMADLVVQVRGFMPNGEMRQFKAAELRFSYRHCDLPNGFIVTEVILKGQVGDYAAIEQKMREIKQSREASQPIKARTGGSSFKNPAPSAAVPNPLKAWQYLEAVGGRGMVRGAAKLSEKHCNFLINTGGATAADLEGLGEELRRLVMVKFGVNLEWEIARIGTAANDRTGIAFTMIDNSDKFKTAINVSGLSDLSHSKIAKLDGHDAE